MADLRCQALDDDGNRCRRMKDVAMVEYFGAEIYGFSNTADWVLVHLCPRHREDNDG